MARAMKDSGIEWIGEIPEEWGMHKTKRYYTNHKNIVGNKVISYDRLALTLSGVIKRSKDDSAGLQPEEFSGYQILNEDELVFKLIDLENISTSRVGLSSYTGIVSPAYIILKGKEGTNTRYGEYFFLSMWQREIFNHMGDDGVRSSLNSSDLLNIPYLFPSEKEQQKIADFLDKKCSEIDSVLVKTKESIEEYKKLKQAIITQAVTKGLRPNRKMKDSGIEWIGEIPEEWEVKRLKYVVNKFEKGSGITKEELVSNGDTSCVRYGEIYSIYDNSFKRCYSLTNKDAISNKQYFSKGDILFAVTGELVEEIGKNIVYLGEEKCLAGGDIIIAKHFQNPKYINYVLNSFYCQVQKSCGKLKLKVVHISANELKNLIVFIASINEQKEIADYLDQKCSEIDDIISKKEKLINELEGYKKSLIYEYVTGKKEVL